MVALKIKRKTLAEETRLIRLEECKWLNETQKARLKQKAARAAKCEGTFNNINHHRRYVVRVESRAAHIARAFLVGKPLEAVEQSWYAMSYVQPNTPLQQSYDMFWDKVLRIVYKFGQGMDRIKGKTLSEVREDIRMWRDIHPQISSGVQYGLDLPTSRKVRTPLTPEQREQRKQAWFEKHGEDWEDPTPY
jgi:hypothetical protein